MANHLDRPLLHVRGATFEEMLAKVSAPDAAPDDCNGVDLSAFSFRVDGEVVDALLNFLARVADGGAVLRLAHCDLGTGTDCEQRIFELKADCEVREAEKAFHEKRKKESSNQRDFSVSAQMRRKAEEGIKLAMARLAAVNEELGSLELQKVDAPWYQLVSRMESPGRSNVVQRLDLTNSCLHATALQHLTHTLLELEQRAGGTKVTELVLDGNDLGDIGMGAIAAYLRLSGHLAVLQLRNVGISNQGVSQVLAGLVSNKSLRFLDLRSNGLCSVDVGQAALNGTRRFNKVAEVLLA